MKTQILVKRFFIILIGIAMLSVTSCNKEDDYDVTTLPQVFLSDTEAEITGNVGETVKAKVIVQTPAGFNNMVIHKLHGDVKKHYRTINAIPGNIYDFEYTIDTLDCGKKLTFRFTVADHKGRTRDMEFIVIIDCDDDDDDIPVPVFPGADHFVKRINNKYLPFKPGTAYTYKGETDEGTEIIVVSVTNETKTILGVECTVVRDVVYLDGDIIEDTFDWYAQDKKGNVWYFGEDSREIEDGEVVSTEGSWEAGVDGALPGIVMLAKPRVGDPYRQEFAPGVAEDVGQVVETGVTVETDLDTYLNCIKTKDWNLLEEDSEEFKYYAPGIGLVREEKLDDEGEIEEEFEITAIIPQPPKFNIFHFIKGKENLYFPLTPGTVYTYEGENEDGEMEEIVVTITNETVTILGVECVVVNDIVSIEGEVAEDTDDWFATDYKGNVWYFGEESKEIEDGVVVSTEGSWKAGVDGALPGIIIHGKPTVNGPYRQEYYLGEAEDIGQVAEVGVAVETDLATYTNCVKIKEWNLLEPDAQEFKFYAPGVGLVKEEEVDDNGETIEEFELISIENGL